MIRDLTFLEALKLFAPLLIIQLGLQIFCLVNIFRKGVANLNKWAWAAIVLFTNMIGPIVYLSVGRKRGYDD